jgi:predicted transcriptional regulator of viral defense system
MVENSKRKQIDKIRDILKDQNGILLTSDLEKLGVPRTYLSILMEKGEIQRISRGVYAACDTLVDEMTSIQARYKRAVFSHETALYLLGLTDRTPLFYSVTVPAAYNATSLKASGAKVYFVKRSLYLLGIITIKSPHGNAIKTFNLERTICDVVRSRNKIDIQLVNEALKKYVIRKDRNIDQLYNFAQQFRIQKIIREYVEVLL